MARAIYSSEKSKGCAPSRSGGVICLKNSFNPTAGVGARVLGAPANVARGERTRCRSEGTRSCSYSTQRRFSGEAAALSALQICLPSYGARGKGADGNGEILDPITFNERFREWTN